MLKNVEAATPIASNSVTSTEARAASTTMNTVNSPKMTTLASVYA